MDRSSSTDRLGPSTGGQTETAPRLGRSQAAIEITIVAPTFNERENVPILVARLDEILRGLRWEIVFVDDESPDGTAAAARRLALEDPRVRLIERIGRRGLSSAIVEGVLSSSAPVFAVMDADLQHDDAKLIEMIARLREDDLDIVVGSRYIDARTSAGLDRRRQAISDFATRVSRMVLHADLTDPMSGFFVMKRRAFDLLVHRLSQQGFKILLDIFASSSIPLRYAEVSCGFHQRLYGESKLDSMAAWEFGMLILDKLFGRAMPVQFIVFCMVGGSGLGVHLTALYLASRAGAAFVTAQTMAVVVAMTWNFFLNNLITYRDRRLRGFLGVLRGLLSFYAVCAFGAVANVGVADIMFQREKVWWSAGIAGAFIGTVWNFAASRYVTWRRFNAGRPAPRRSKKSSRPSAATQRN